MYYTEQTLILLFLILLMQEKTEEKKEEVKKLEETIEETHPTLVPIMKSVQIALDSYNDIFSDFDYSSYSSRILSDDFLKEVKKRYYENKKGDFELKFTLPTAKRNTKVENIIKKRLKDYFKGEVEYFNDRIEKTKKDGLLRVAIGFVLLSIEVLLLVLEVSDLYISVLSVIIVPAGWYGFYSGFTHLFESTKEFESPKLFNEKYYKAKYEFFSEEDLMKTTEAAATEQK